MNATSRGPRIPNFQPLTDLQKSDLHKTGHNTIISVITSALQCDEEDELFDHENIDDFDDSPINIPFTNSSFLQKIPFFSPTSEEAPVFVNMTHISYNTASSFPLSEHITSKSLSNNNIHILSPISQASLAPSIATSTFGSTSTTIFINSCSRSVIPVACPQQTEGWLSLHNSASTQISLQQSNITLKTILKKDKSPSNQENASELSKQPRVSFNSQHEVLSYQESDKEKKKTTGWFDDDVLFSDEFEEKPQPFLNLSNSAVQQRITSKLSIKPQKRYHSSCNIYPIETELYSQSSNSEQSTEESKQRLYDDKEDQIRIIMERIRIAHPSELRKISLLSQD